MTYSLLYLPLGFEGMQPNYFTFLRSCFHLRSQGKKDKKVDVKKLTYRQIANKMQFFTRNEDHIVSSELVKCCQSQKKTKVLLVFI